MKKIIYLVGLLAIAGCVKQKASGYSYKIDLTNSADDKIPVELKYNGTLTDTTTFFLPEIIPGIYDTTNFGKYVSDLRAFDANGNQLKVIKKGKNSWKIIGANSLTRLTYNVDDGWEQFDFTDLRPYRSAESSFNKDIYIISPPSIFGYFKGYKDETFKISVTKPSSFYGATSLPVTSRTDSIDYYQTSDYKKLVDNPILYSLPDTTKIVLPNIEVEVACFSSGNIRLSKKIAEHIKPLLENQTTYLGGKLPMKKYTFMIYHNLNPDESAYFSEGLEHAASTIVLMYTPDNIESIKQTVYHTASHEFFHTIMPIGLHSEEISNYDFNNPTFSKHIWLYEGMTEYFTIHMPIKQGLVSLEEFIGVIEGKVSNMKKYEAELPIVELSKNPMKYQDQYMNVYFKGPLLNLCLDIKLRELSGGKYGVQDMVQDLINEYGSEKPFKDDELFDEIVRIAGFNELQEFFRKYVENSNTIPLVAELEKVGLNLDWETGKIEEVIELSNKQKKLRKYWVNQ
jgi:predicted metalloprotease with PDZ domain